MKKPTGLSAVKSVMGQIPHALSERVAGGPKQAKRPSHAFLAGTASRGICRYLKVSMWRSEAMYRLPNQGDARLLYLFLLTGPHTLTCHVPGLYQVGKESLREELRLKGPVFRRALSDLEKSVGLKTDFHRSLVWAPTALDHLGPPANPNIVLSYCRALSQMPESPLVLTAIEAYGPYLAVLGESFSKPFRNHFPMVSRTVSKPFTKEREREKERETERAADEADGEPAPGSLQEQQGKGVGDLPGPNSSLSLIRQIREKLEGSPEFTE